MTDKNQSMLENWSKTDQKKDFVNIFPLFFQSFDFCYKDLSLFCACQNKKNEIFFSIAGSKSFTISDRTPLILSQIVVKFPLREFFFTTSFTLCGCKIVNLISSAISKQPRHDHRSRRLDIDFWNILNIEAMSILRRRTWKQRLHSSAMKTHFRSTRSTPEEFENSTFTGHFAFVFEKNC